MVKKNWSTPEVMVLDLNQTKCEEGVVGDEVTLDGEKLIYGCPYCNKRFWEKKYRDNHIKKCHPAGVPTNPLPDFEEGPAMS